VASRDRARPHPPTADPRHAPTSPSPAPLDPATLPERIEEAMEPLPGAPAACIAWNRYGTLLAAGGGDGAVAVWDMDTRGVARRAQAHG